MRNILVTGIGGIVGQGILRNIRAMNTPFGLVGTNTFKISAGNHLCDDVIVVPPAVDTLYIPAIKHIIRTYKIELIIPSTDYESFYLSESASTLDCSVATSPSDVTKLCLDKYINFLEFSKRKIPFANSILPSQFENQFSNFIVKPREGRGSRDVFFNPPNIKNFDDAFIVQEYLSGPEITVTFYVLQTGEIHGFIVLTRLLENGSTVQCEVTRQYDTEIEQLIKLIVNNFNFRGSVNLQCKVTQDGPIPFEINCRISGTNSIRSQFGFPDVEYTVRELLLNEKPTTPSVQMGCAIRIVRDLIYPNRRLAEISNADDIFHLY